MNSEPRDNKIFAIVGGRRCGKSEMVQHELIPGYEKKGLPTLVIQTKYNPRYEGKQNIFTVSDYSQIRETIKKTYNAAIVFEEAKTLFGSRLNDDVIAELIHTGQCNVDIYFIFQCWAWVPKDLMRILDYFIVFEAKDGPEARKGDLSEFEITEINKGLRKLQNRTENEPKYFMVEHG